MQVFKSIDEIGLDKENYPIIQKWLSREDHCAIYENVEIGHPEERHRQFVSFGSEKCQIEVKEASELPIRLPDIGGKINWRYRLIGIL